MPTAGPCRSCASSASRVGARCRSCRDSSWVIGGRRPAGRRLPRAQLARVGAWELFRIARAGGARPIEAVGIPLAALIPIVLAAEPRGVFTIGPGFAAVVLLVVLALAIWLRRDDGHALSAVATTVFGASYTGGLLSFAFAIRYHRYVGDDRGGVGTAAASRATHVGQRYRSVCGGPARSDDAS